MRSKYATNNIRILSGSATFAQREAVQICQHKSASTNLPAQICQHKSAGTNLPAVNLSDSHFSLLLICPAQNYAMSAIPGNAIIILWSTMYYALITLNYVIVITCPGGMYLIYKSDTSRLGVS